MEIGDAICKGRAVVLRSRIQWLLTVCNNLAVMLQILPNVIFKIIHTTVVPEICRGACGMNVDFSSESSQKTSSLCPPKPGLDTMCGLLHMHIGLACSGMAGRGPSGETQQMTVSLPFLDWVSSHHWEKGYKWHLLMLQIFSFAF